MGEGFGTEVFNGFLILATGAIFGGIFTEDFTRGFLLFAGVFNVLLVLVTGVVFSGVKFFNVFAEDFTEGLVTFWMLLEGVFFLIITLKVGGRVRAGG